MKVNNLFSLKRFILVFRQSLIVNKKLLGISLAGATGTLFVSLVIFQSMAAFRLWDQGDSMATFLAFFFISGIAWTGLSFPAFRSKEKSISYLMLPSSTSEKFVFEILTRIVAFIIVMPLLYWIVANLEGAVVHHYKANLIHYTFSYKEAWTEFTKNSQLNQWNIFAFIQGGLFLFIAAFAGASHFTKSPIVKTIFTFSVIAVGYAFLSYLLFNGMNIKDYLPSGNTVLHIHTKNEATLFFALAATVVNISLLTISWFRLKEREV